MTVIPQAYPLWAVFENLGPRSEGLTIPAFCLVIGWLGPTGGRCWPVVVDTAARGGEAVVVTDGDKDLIHYFADYDAACELRTYLTRGGS